MDDGRAYGTATTDDEADLERVLALVPEWQGVDVRYWPVSGGITNLNWRVRVDGEPHQFFVKVPGAGTEALVNRATAARATEIASQQGCTPPLWRILPEAGVEIVEFLEGHRSARNEDFLDPDFRHAALAGLRAFHQGPPLPATTTVFDMLDEHRERMAEVDARLPADLDELLGRVAQVRDVLPDERQTIGPCMNDCLAANFIVPVEWRPDTGPVPVRLVDFEYATNNLVHYELALWCGELFFPIAIQHEVLADYFGAVTARDDALVWLLRAVADVKWACWARIQERCSPLEFDFARYGDWKFLRARAVIDDPRWTGWLAAADAG